MNHYVLIQHRPDATAIVGKTQAGTLKQAMRKLYRQHNLNELEVRALGYKVEVITPTNHRKDNHV